VASSLFFDGCLFSTDLMPYLLACWFLTTLLLAPSMATAQVIQDWETKQFSFEQVDKDRVRLMREVEVNGTGPNKGQQMFADELLWNTTTGELEALGNVTLVSPTARLSADRVVFNTKTGLGTFYSASGLAALGDRAADDRSMFGTLEPDVYFYGEIIEKVGEDRYVISKGAFTTCVQPSPRWEIVSTKTTINLEDYAFLRNAVIRVKDVPVFYLPVLYYPIQSDDRATGFLLPSYGRSTIRGQSISNAFFWAIDRSQDLTFLHDWFTSTGQGAGAEYRYVAAPGAEGFFRAYWLDEDESTIDNSGGGSLTTPSARSYELRGDAAQPLPGGFRARARIDYFSSLTTSQLYHTNIYESTRRNRSIAGSVSGNWAGVSLTGNYRRDELFYSTTASTLNGQTPVVSANLSSRRLGLSPFYVAFNSEFGRILYASHAEIDGVEAVDDRSLGRFDLSPTLRATLSTLPFLSVNGTVAYRHTYLTESLDDEGLQIESPVTRRYFDVRADVTGPVFSKVFTPNNAFADRLKHVIEPNINFQRITDYDNEDRIPTTAGVYDVVIGGVTRVNYGINNRFLVRKAPNDPNASAAASAPREFLSVAITQSYYTDPRASQFDTGFQSGYGSWRPPSSFSPLALTARANPTASSSGTVRVEYDTKVGTLEAFNATGSTTYRAAQTSIGWSTRRISADARDNSINAQTNLSFLQRRTGGSYLLDWDIARETILQQRWVGFYNAQCCGIVLEYQERNFPSFDPNFPYPKDRRFNLSFTLAGVGTFSNFFGVFGGTTY
jgi:lipopolysaccharide assembly outer membrane protein LptD (OstA)